MEFEVLGIGFSVSGFVCGMVQSVGCRVQVQALGQGFQDGIAKNLCHFSTAIPCF